MSKHNPILCRKCGINKFYDLNSHLWRDGYCLDCWLDTKKTTKLQTIGFKCFTVDELLFLFSYFIYGEPVCLVCLTPVKSNKYNYTTGKCKHCKKEPYRKELTKYEYKNYSFDEILDNLEKYDLVKYVSDDYDNINFLDKYFKAKHKPNESKFYIKNSLECDHNNIIRKLPKIVAGLYHSKVSGKIYC